MLVGAAEDVAQAPDPDFAKATMDRGEARRARRDPPDRDVDDGPDARSAPSDQIDARQRDRRRAAHGVRVVLVALPVRLERRRRSPTSERADFAAFAADVAKRYPTRARLHRRQRAEPEPLLAAAVQPRRRATPPRPPTSRCSRTTYDALKAVRPHSTIYGGALAPRGVDKPGTGRDTHSPTAFIPTSAPPTGRAGGRRRSWTPSRSTPTRRPRATGPNFRAPEHDDDRGRRLREARLAARRRPSTARRSAARRCRSSTTSSASRRRSRPAKAPLYTGAEPATTKPVDEATQARVLPAGDADRLLPADRDGAPALPRRGRAGRCSAWQSGVYYVDGTPKSSLVPVRRRRRSGAPRRRRPVPRPAARRRS